MVSSHDDFTNKILSAIKAGQDPLAVLSAGRDHLMECPACRENVTRMAKSLLGIDLSLVEELFISEAEKEQAEPPRYPAPDFTFGRKRIIHVAETVNLHLIMPRSRSHFKGFSSDQLASMVISAAPPNKVDRAGQALDLPGTTGLKVNLETRYGKDDLLELDIRFFENRKGYSAVAVKLAGEREEEEKTSSLSKEISFQHLSPGEYELKISLLGPSQIPVIVWKVKLILQVSFYLNLKSSRKATGGL